MYGHTIHHGSLAASAIYAKAEDRQRGIHSHKTLIPTNYAKAEKQQSKKELNSSLVVVVVVAAAAALQRAHFLSLYCCPNIKRKKIVLIFLLNIAFHFRFSFHSQTVVVLGNTTTKTDVLNFYAFASSRLRRCM